MATRRTAINVCEVTIKGKKYQRAGFVPTKEQAAAGHKVKDFFAKLQGSANAKRAAHEDDLAKNPGRGALDNKTTLQTFLTGTFEAVQKMLVANGNLSLGTYADRKNRIERFVVNSGAGKTVISRLMPSDIQKLFESLGVSAEVLRTLKNDLHVAFKILGSDDKQQLPRYWKTYFDFVGYKLPQVEGKSQDDKAFFSPALILAKCEDESYPLLYRTLLMFLICILARPQSMWSLTWNKVFFDDATPEEGEILIDCAMKRTEVGYKVGLPKTGKEGIGRVRLAHPLLDKLLRELKAQSKGDLVFVHDQDGKPLDNDRFRYVWARMKAVMELPDGPGFYSLKTTGATLLFDMGASLEEVARQTLHTDTRMAMKHYVRWKKAAASPAQYWVKFEAARVAASKVDTIAS